MSWSGDHGERQALALTMIPAPGHLQSPRHDDGLSVYQHVLAGLSFSAFSGGGSLPALVLTSVQFSAALRSSGRAACAVSASLMLDSVMVSLSSDLSICLSAVS